MLVNFSSPLVAFKTEVSEDMIAWLYFIVYPAILQTGSYVMGEEIAQLTSNGGIDSSSMASQIYSALSVRNIAQEKAQIMSELSNSDESSLALSAKELVSNYFRQNIHKVSMELVLKNTSPSNALEQPYWVDPYAESNLP